ncbi:MAG: DNA mismatch repair endonuclease MutL [Clostridiales bacterium]|jgi:DNA mismatch repair protein MutL|nr:DNA mismatch repair endonuclease MutL [Clostridiales bacterium]
MPDINILDSSVYNKISAGEVIERPSSIVKELIENSIDAGAFELTVEIEEGGIKSVKVSDNGAGIDEKNIKKAFLPHATSKILKSEDLFTISSLGFRGEALASIAAVSIVGITSKTEGQDAACAMEIKDGIFGDIKYTAANRGTVITVNDLFYNEPPRLKFLKRPKIEEGYISSVISKFILAYPDVAFTYKADGKMIYQTKGAGLENAVYEVYGKEISDNLIAVDYTNGYSSLKGYISVPGYYKSNKTYQTVFINGRIVDNALISAAVLKAYGDNIMKRNFPILILDIIMPFDEVDVNAHPTKSDVRFSDENKVFSFILHAVRARINDCINGRREIAADITKTALPENKADKKEDVNQYNDFWNGEASKKAPLQTPAEAADKSVSFEADKGQKRTDINIEALKALGRGSFGAQFRSNAKNTLNENTSPFVIPQYGAPQADIKIGVAPYDAPSAQKTTVFADAPKDRAVVSEADIFETKSTASKTRIFDFVNDGRLVGQVLNCYIIFEYLNEMYLIDQHAVHERINYDRLKSKDRKKDSQIFLVPYIFSLNHAEISIINGLKDYLCDLGFDIEYFGGNDYKISAAPIDIDIKKFISDLLSEIKDTRQTNDYLEEKIIQTACKSSIKSGDGLNALQLNEFVKLIKNSDIAPTCPHGRPVYIKISKNDLDKMFKRIV